MDEIIKEKSELNHVENNLQENPADWVSSKVTFPTLSTIGKLGSNSLKKFSLVIVVFGLINLIFAIIGLVKFSGAATTQTYLGLSSIIVVLGIGFTGFAVYKTYQYVLTDGLKLVYTHTSPLFYNICSKIVDGVTAGAKGLNLKESHIQRTINIADTIAEVYNNKLPSIVQKGIGLVVSRIPFSSYLLNMTDILRTGNKIQAANTLYEQVDYFITEDFIGENSMKWGYWLAAINIVVQTALICIL